MNHLETKKCSPAKNSKRHKLQTIWTALVIGKISLTSPIVINVATRASLALETKGLLFPWLGHLHNNEMFVNRYLPYRMKWNHFTHGGMNTTSFQSVSHQQIMSGLSILAFAYYAMKMLKYNNASPHPWVPMSSYHTSCSPPIITISWVFQSPNPVFLREFWPFTACTFTPPFPVSFVYSLHTMHACTFISL